MRAGKEARVQGRTLHRTRNKLSQETESWVEGGSKRQALGEKRGTEGQGRI